MKTKEEIIEMREKLMKDREQAVAQINMIAGAIQACDLMLTEDVKKEEPVTV